MFYVEDILEIPNDFYGKKLVVYNEGEHIINIVKSVYRDKILKDPYTSLGNGFELSVPEGYKLINAFALDRDNILYIFANDVPVVVEKSNIKNTINIGRPYGNHNIKLTKKY